jgi:hypothetical protein
MGSKFFKSKDHFSNRPIIRDTDGKPAEWYTFSSMREPEKPYVNPRIAEKNRIENIPADKLTFRDLYKFPFRMCEHSSWVFDANNNFIFQFQINNLKARLRIMDVLNDIVTDHNRREVKNEDGMISAKFEDEWAEIILIRGWGNLTGVGAYNLSSGHAERIQDTLMEYIMETLTFEKQPWELK